MSPMFPLEPFNLPGLNLENPFADEHHSFLPVSPQQKVKFFEQQLKRAKAEVKVQQKKVKLFEQQLKKAKAELKAHRERKKAAAKARKATTAQKAATELKHMREKFERTMQKMEFRMPTLFTPKAPSALPKLQLK